MGTAYRSINKKLDRVLGRMLRPARPPVAVARVSRTPGGIPRFRGRVPSMCSFWPRAQRRLFVAEAADHMNCPVGALIGGFELTAAARRQLGDAVAMMCRVGYLRPGEAEKISTMPRGTRAILYGPLARFPARPEFVLMWLRPAQAMILREAVGGKILGRPACSALPAAHATGHATFSLGCTGMRAFTGVDEAMMLSVLPHEALRHVEARLRRIVAANRAMKAYYDRNA
jgi:uncharacterized protein (DUF169 family)